MLGTDLVDDGLIVDRRRALDDMHGTVLVPSRHAETRSADSVLALRPLPAARKNGHVYLHPHNQVRLNLAGRLDELHVVIDGQDIDGNGKYEGRTTAPRRTARGRAPCRLRRDPPAPAAHRLDVNVSPATAGSARVEPRPLTQLGFCLLCGSGRCSCPAAVETKRCFIFSPATRHPQAIAISRPLRSRCVVGDPVP